MLILWPIWSLVAIVSLSCVGQPAVRGRVYKVRTQSSCMDYWVLLFLKETDTSCSFSVLSYKTMCIFHSFTVAVSFQFRGLELLQYLRLISLFCCRCGLSRQRFSVMNWGVLGRGVGGIDDHRSLRAAAVFTAAGFVSLTASISGKWEQAHMVTTGIIQQEKCTDI